MKVYYSPHFKQKYKPFSKTVKKKFQKQMSYLLSDFRHPSLQVKKYDEERNIWQARVDKKYRFYFLIKKDTYFFLDIKPHP